MATLLRGLTFSSHLQCSKVAKILLITGLGFIYSLFTVAYSVLFLRKAEGKVVVAPPSKKKVEPKKTGPAPAPPKAYSDATMAFLAKTTILSGILSVLVQTILQKDNASFATPLQTFFFFCATLCYLCLGSTIACGNHQDHSPSLDINGLDLGIVVLVWCGHR
jgi:hypothetical protein